MKNKFFYLLSGVLTLSGVFAAPTAPQAAVPVVAVEPAVELKTINTNKYVGQLTAEHDIDLTARITGIILEQKFKNGDLVKKGQLLFLLEDTTYRAQAEAAKALLKQNEAELKYAKSNLNRNATLRSHKAVAQSNFEDAERLYYVKEAKVAENRASLLEAENSLSYTKVFSPIVGRVGEAVKDPGNLVSPSCVLVNIVSLDPVNADFSISQRDYLQLFNGDINTIKKYADVRLELADGSIYDFAGNVTFVNNKVDPETDTIKIRAMFKNPKHKLNPGGLVTVLLSRKVLSTYTATLPSALMIDNQGSYLLVVGKNGNVERRNVKLGSLNNNRQIIESGIKPGEQVIVDGTHKAIIGKPVKAIPVKLEQ